MQAHLQVKAYKVLCNCQEHWDAAQAGQGRRGAPGLVVQIQQMQEVRRMLQTQVLIDQMLIVR